MAFAEPTHETHCRGCGRPVTVCDSDVFPRCGPCREREARARGWKPWAEMSLEERVEDLDRRVGFLEDCDGRTSFDQMIG